MYSKRKSFNQKRRIASMVSQTQLEALASRVRYGGNPEHKRNPGDFGLTPSFLPKPDKTLCDLAGIVHRAEAERLLREGIQRGLVSEWNGEGFPKNVWAVTRDGFPLEGQLENADNGTYHGYPMPEADAFREQVIDRWRANG
jgi:hypothetical protein